MCTLPLLFSIYTNEVQCDSNDLSLIKYADDMVLVAWLQHTNIPLPYCQFINNLVSWFDSSFMDLNVTKTKELGGNRSAGNTGSIPTYELISMKGQKMKQVTHFKYLGTFQHNTDYIYKKAWQRLTILSKLRSFNTSQSTLFKVYTSLVEIILTYNITW